MNKRLIAVALAAATMAGAAYAQQATTGQNQSNPRAGQESGPVGTTNPGAPMTRPTMRDNNNNMNSSTAPAPAASDSTMRTGRAPRADRN